MEGFELSPQQKHLWQLQTQAKLQDLSLNSPYQAQCAIHITGKVEAAPLKAAINNVISNHEILRTTFASVPGVSLPLQVISPNAQVTFNQHDYKSTDLSQQPDKVDQLWEQIYQNRLPQTDSDAPSHFQCDWLCFSDTQSLLFLTLSALYTDAKGLDNLALEILSSYDACAQGIDPGVDQNTAQLANQSNDVLQYADISEWQNQLLQENDEELIFSKAYWREQNIANSLSLKLPLEKTSDSDIRFNPSSCDLAFPPDQLAKVSVFIQRENPNESQPLSLFFLTCWQIFLWRITQNADITVGIDSNLRQYEELQDTIGLISKQLPLKSTFQKGLSFQEAINNTAKALNETYRWQERFSWNFIVGEQSAEVAAPYIPFGFEFTQVDQRLSQKNSTEKNNAENISFEMTKREVYCDRFKAKLSLTQNQEHLSARLYYDANLLDISYVQCLAEQFQTLVTNILESDILDDPATGIENIALTSEASREKILRQFNLTDSDYPQDKCIHQLFEQQVGKTPDAIAATFQEKTLTYQQLNQKANQLAHYLQSIGVSSEVLVGIFVERSLDMLVGLLAILKAGGAYVPLDATYPTERLEHMLTDAQLPILLTQQHLRPQIPQTQTQIICLDAHQPNLSQYASDNPSSNVQPGNLAYVIYTSGSTGKPKGTMILHRGMVNYLSWAREAYRVAEGEGSTVNSSIGFDATITSLFSPLLVGKKVVLLPQTGEIEALKSALSSNTKFSLVKITPAHLEILSHLFDSEAVNIQTKAFIIGGEALSEQVASFWQQNSPNTRLINEYGPTETVVGCCTYEVNEQDIGRKNIPIGRPIANTQLYILDEQLQPLPIGVAGELYIGGEGVARGYLNRPELTSERFITLSLKSPLGHAGRLYKTGDLARYLPDGNIEYLGRIDTQVKIRGFRIELGEVESALTAHPQIQQAVVIAREEKTGSKRLIGYVLPENGFTPHSITSKQLREYLSARLPEYMVPSAFVTLDQFPLTPNGKIDRKALPATDQEPEREHPYVAPRNPIEEVIADIFSNILNVQTVGIHDNFFELGGHSLLAFRLISELKQKFQTDLPLAALFQSPTIAQLATLIDSDLSQKRWSPVIPLYQASVQPQDSLAPLFLIGGAGGNAIYLQPLAQHLGQDRSVYGLQAQGLDGTAPPLQSIPEIAVQYIEAIQSLQPQGPYWLAGHSFGGKIAFEIAIQLQQKGESVAFVGILDTPAPLPESNLEQAEYETWDNATWLSSIAETIEGLIEKEVNMSYSKLVSLTETQQLKYFQTELESVEFLPPNSDAKLVHGLLDVYKAQCLIQYLPEQSPSIPVTLFRAQEISTEQENALPLLQDPTWGWATFSSQKVEVLEVPGNHVSMMRPPHVQSLAKQLNQSLLTIQNSYQTLHA